MTTVKKFITTCLAVTMVLMILLQPQSGFAASEDAQGPGPSSGPRRHLATIIFSGLGGAVLGLSTLSFYGRPQDRLGNIGVGFALGIIAGTVYVTYEMIKVPTEFYGLNAPKRLPTDHTLWEAPQDPNDSVMHSSMSRQVSAQTSSPGTALQIANFNWSF